jgi:hypothetical protein
VQFSIATHFVKDHGGVWGVSDPYLSDASSSEGYNRGHTSPLILFREHTRYVV